MIKQYDAWINESIDEIPLWSVPMQAIGKLCNTVALFESIWGSIILLVVADNTVDIILNSLAVLFVITIDNDIVSEQDTKNAAIIMKNRLIFRNDAYHYKKEYSTFKGYHNLIKTMVYYIRLVGFLIVVAGLLSFIYVPICKFKFSAKHQCK